MKEVRGSTVKGQRGEEIKERSKNRVKVVPNRPDKFKRNTNKTPTDIDEVDELDLEVSMKAIREMSIGFVGSPNADIPIGQVIEDDGPVEEQLDLGSLSEDTDGEFTVEIEEFAQLSNQEVDNNEELVEEVDTNEELAVENVDRSAVPTKGKSFKLRRQEGNTRPEDQIISSLSWTYARVTWKHKPDKYGRYYLNIKLSTGHEMGVYLVEIPRLLNDFDWGLVSEEEWNRETQVVGNETEVGENISMLDEGNNV